MLGHSMLQEEFVISLGLTSQNKIELLWHSLALDVLLEGKKEKISFTKGESRKNLEKLFPNCYSHKSQIHCTRSWLNLQPQRDNGIKRPEAISRRKKERFGDRYRLLALCLNSSRACVYIDHYDKQF